MGTEFWAGVIVTLIVGIPVAYVIGLFANMHAPKLALFLESRKLLKRANTRKQALVAYNRIKDFRENRRDRYPYYMLLASAATMCAILAAVLLLMISKSRRWLVVGSRWGIRRWQAYRWLDGQGS
jgi:hypothetical protein